MFTGIVEELGRVLAVERDGDRGLITIGCHLVLDDAEVGSSIAVDGCCLTVRALGDGAFTADLMAETLRATTLGDLGEGGQVNLERPLRADGRFGGHLVQGHVDGVGEVVRVGERPGTRSLTIAAPDAVAAYLVAKGSVAVSGVSLTVVGRDGAADGAHFEVGLVPHTAEATTLGRVGVGDRVNLEADIVAKYVERMLDGREEGS